MKKVVMIRRTGLGDFIAGTVPICNYLEKIYRECELCFFMKKHNSFLVKYVFPNAHVYNIPECNKYIQTLITALKYRHLNTDIGFSPMPDYPKLNSLFLYLINAKERYGRTTKNIFTKYFNHPYDCPGTAKLYESSVGLCSLKYYDKNITEIPIECHPKFNQNMISNHPLSKADTIQIMVEVSNNRNSSQLCADKTAKILNTLYKQYKFSILITAKVPDVDKASALKAKLDMPTDIFTTPIFDEFLSYVNASDIVLCGDGGLGHIADALDKKIVSLYGITSIPHWGIISDKVIHLYDHENINNIEDSKILDALTVQLKSS